MSLDVYAGVNRRPSSPEGVQCDIVSLKLRIDDFEKMLRKPGVIFIQAVIQRYDSAIRGNFSTIRGRIQRHPEQHNEHNEHNKRSMQQLANQYDKFLRTLNKRLAEEKKMYDLGINPMKTKSITRRRSLV